MHIVVVHRQVPDVVEELLLTEDGKALDEDQIRYIGNEPDEHALEQASLLKERHGGKVTCIAVGGDEARDVLATAKAKGADDVIHVALKGRGHGDNHQLAALLLDTIKALPFDLILTGTQAVEDLDGSLGGVLAAQLDLPYVGYLAGVDVDPGRGVASVKKEYPGGLLAVMEVGFPAVFGIQAAERPPRYIPVSRVVQLRKSMAAKEFAPPLPEVQGVPEVAFSKPQPVTRARLLEGDAKTVSEAIIRILAERDLI